MNKLKNVEVMQLRGTPIWPYIIDHTKLVRDDKKLADIYLRECVPEQLHEQVRSMSFNLLKNLPDKEGA